MKKIILSAALALLMGLQTVNAQVKFGVKGGLNVTSMSLSSKVFDADNQVGFFIGPTAKISLPLTGLGVDIAALYDQRSAKPDFEVPDDGLTTTSADKLKMQSIQIPVNLRYGVGLGSTASAFIFAGPQFGFNVGDKEKHLNFGDWKLKTSNFSVNVGLGVSLLQHLQISANYNIACGTTGDIGFKDVTSGVINKAKANAWQIAAAYYF